MWTRVELPGYIFERMLGFSLPVDNHVAIIAYEGIHVIDLQAPASVPIDRRYPEGGEIYDKSKQLLLYDGKNYKIMGLFGADPILDSAQGESLLLDLVPDVWKFLDGAEMSRSNLISRISPAIGDMQPFPRIQSIFCWVCHTTSIYSNEPNITRTRPL